MGKILKKILKCEDLKNKKAEAYETADKMSMKLQMNR